jgi:hypothetical protein
MYGMIHEGLREMVVARSGVPAWERVCATAGAAQSSFQTTSPYPDEISVGLVVAAAGELGLDVHSLLIEFGRFWVTFALKTNYGPLLRGSGSTLRQTLAALDAMHAGIGLSLPELRPPSFRVEERAGDTILHYFSERDGLAPMVVGLVEGLAAMHGTTATVEQVAAKADGSDHDTFVVTTGA